MLLRGLVRACSSGAKLCIADPRQQRGQPGLSDVGIGWACSSLLPAVAATSVPLAARHSSTFKGIKSSGDASAAGDEPVTPWVRNVVSGSHLIRSPKYNKGAPRCSAHTLPTLG